MEFVDAGEPDVVDKPHDTTLNFSNPPAFFLSAALSKASHRTATRIARADNHHCITLNGHDLQ